MLLKYNIYIEKNFRFWFPEIPAYIKIDFVILGESY
jgi:hypothetical protein